MEEKEFLDKVALCVYKAPDELNEEESRLISIEMVRCATDFRYFTKYGRIVETPTINNPGGTIPFQITPHVNCIIDAFSNKQLISILKSRQIYVSYTTAFYALWHVMFHEGATWLFFSRRETEAFELLGKAYRLYNLLPPFLHLKQQPDSQGEMGFPSMKSRIIAFPSAPGSGIGLTASGIVSDEHEKHPFAEINYEDVKPTIETSGGQYISIFTVDKRKPITLAKSLFRHGEVNIFNPISQQLERDKTEEWGFNTNGFYSMFFPYNVILGRDEAWYENRKRNLTPDELEGLTPELYMESNYPRSLVEALRPTQTTSAFNHQVLDEMMGDTRNPIKIIRDGIDPQIVKVYQPFHLGEYYIAASDSSHGVGRDFHVTAIMNVKTGCVVCDIMDNSLSIEEFALHSVRALGLYQSPLWWPEDNEWGRVVITIAQTLGYKRFGYRETKIGWHTDEKTRLDLFGSLIPAINNHQITIYNAQGLRQFYDIIRNVEKEGRIEAMGSRHDDYPIAVGICWCKKGEVHTEPFSYKPIETLHFRRR